MDRETQKKEALSRLKELTKAFKLNPHILDYFKEDRLYYSYLTPWGCIDTITYDPRYEEVVKRFEQRLSCLVYHAIETGNTLSLLFVSAHQEDWPAERLQKNYILAYVHNFEDPDFSEIGDIWLTSDNGALLRNG